MGKGIPGNIVKIKKNCALWGTVFHVLYHTIDFYSIEKYN